MLDQQKGKSSRKNESFFPEHEFLGLCVRNGITYEFLKQFTYVDIMKILVSFIDNNEEKEQEATQQDIDRLLM